MADHMLTTIDNPYSPFTHYSDWLAYDERLGYGTQQLLARCVTTSDQLSEADQDLDIERAIDEIVSENLSGMHIKIGPTDIPRSRLAASS